MAGSPRMELRRRQPPPVIATSGGAWRPAQDMFVPEKTPSAVRQSRTAHLLAFSLQGLIGTPRASHRPNANARRKTAMTTIDVNSLLSQMRRMTAVTELPSAKIDTVG